MTPGAYLDSIGFLGDDVVAAHGVWLTPEEIRTFACKKTAWCTVPSRIRCWPQESRGRGHDPRRRRSRLGTDGPAGSNNNLDMIERWPAPPACKSDA